MRAYDRFYSTPRILAKFARLKIVPGIGMLYGRRIRTRLERVNRRFVDSLRTNPEGRITPLRSV
jgi:hypothetical protein